MCVQNGNISPVESSRDNNSFENSISIYFYLKKKHFLHTLLKNQTYLTLQIIFHYILSVSVHDEFNESYILNANLLNLGTIHQRIIHIIYEVLRVNMKDELKK